MATKRTTWTSIVDQFILIFEKLLCMFAFIFIKETYSFSKIKYNR